MKAMILAAGRGQRLKPLTDTCPKPLLSIGNDSLLSRHIKQLKNSGISEIVINHAWLGQKIEEALGDGSQFGVSITYSPEGELGLETAGGIKKALPMLGDEPFLVINGDILTDFNFKKAFNIKQELIKKHIMAHLWLISYPVSHHPTGDYSISSENYLIEKAYPSYTFSGIAVYHPDFFVTVPEKTPYKLASLFHQYIPEKMVQAELFPGLWLDVGTIDRLNHAKQIIQNRKLQ
ncbi:MAG: NTP transferase domain-containing protein [Neisseriaceae bacterium]|nr:MAG: NTP transferase domain-containing protein [Neisseriaceae bacterium]